LLAAFAEENKWPDKKVIRQTQLLAREFPLLGLPCLAIAAIHAMRNDESFTDGELWITELWEKCKELAGKDSRFKILKLSRNFRMDGGITAGLDYISGEACVVMTADLQDPPEMISVFLRKWESGWENIYGVLERRIGTGFIRDLNSKIFYLVAWKLSGGKIPKNASDFRLVDRKVYEAVKVMTERNRFVRGLFAWVGFKSIGVPMERPQRFGGVSKAHSTEVIDLALKGLLANSYKPLRLISIVGLILSGISFLSIFPLAIIWFISGVFSFNPNLPLLFIYISYLKSRPNLRNEFGPTYVSD
jgi:dolichol-phosphate mannosyltransferase